MTKLIQLNMWTGRLEKPLKTFLKQQQPDILCLQEAISYPRDDAGFFVSIEQIQKICDLPYAIFGPNISFNLMNNTAQEGNCILSKHPIQKSEVTFTRLEHNETFDFNDHDGNVRNLVHAIIEVGGKPYNILTHHGFWVPNHKNGTQETEEGTRIIGEYIDGLDGPVILTGDFNLAPHSKSLEPLNKRLNNLSTQYKLTTTRTPLTHKEEVCDYIFTSKDITVTSFEASEEIVSDHQALLLEF